MGTLDDVRQSLAMLQAGMVRPVISAKVTFPEAAKAHGLLEARAVSGRVLMRGW